MRRTLVPWFLVLVLSLALPYLVAAQTPAFPSAEGFGAGAQGGRGGKACHVNSLAPGSGSGGSCNAGGCGGSAPFSAGTVTLRDCMAGRLDAGPRTVIFRVGGVIDYGQQENPWVTPPFLTIAGQTAPGTGMMIRGLDMPFYQTSHIIVRHLRNRNRYYSTGAGAFGVYETSGCIDCIFDHVSFGWNQDDAGFCSYYGADRCTWQWSLATEGLTADDYNKFGLVSTTNPNPPTYGGVSFLHNFIAQILNRVPWQQGSSVQFINNIVYNVGDASAIFSNDFAGQAPKSDWENNYYKTGPQQPDGTRVGLALARACYPPEAGCTAQGVTYAQQSQIYLSGNYNNVTRPNNSFPEDSFTVQWYSGEPLRIVTTKPAHFPTIPSMVSAQQAASTALLAKIGAYAGLPQGRDSIDQRGIDSFVNNTGGTLSGTTATVCSDGKCGETGVYTTGTPYADTDGDGMSDAWEDSHGLNKNDPSDGPLITASGYSNLELFINWLAGDDRPLVGALPAPPRLPLFTVQR